MAEADARQASSLLQIRTALGQLPAKVFNSTLIQLNSELLGLAFVLD
jgi:hypothetical protein